MKRIIFLITAGLVAVVSGLLLIGATVVIAVDKLSEEPAGGIASLLQESVFGYIILVTLAILTLASIIALYFLWNRGQYWKDLRFKMAFYLYHSKVNRGDRIPLYHLRNVGVAGHEDDIVKVLQRMIDQEELKGRIEREQGIYIHLGLTRKGVDIVMALPPAKLGKLAGVKRLALQSPEWERDESYILEESENIEELPFASHGEDEEKGEITNCPTCGMPNSRSIHFCTYCGEVLD